MSMPNKLVFGLDIGTRSIVGTVGYKVRTNQFRVVAQVVREHRTRAMMDGQIHDIGAVAETIGLVKRELETMIGQRLTDVCIAAAGRVLKTVEVSAEYEFPEDTVVTDEHIYSLDMLGVEKAYEQIREEARQEKVKYYSVGHSAVRYYLNSYSMSNLEGHTASKIGVDLLVTFLPEEVVDGLYRAVERAGLYVANLTLEPIAAINVAIPEKFRLLNIALVDVGAGTSDICITKDGTITAYGMIPYAGDEITEHLAKEYLLEFQAAERMKVACSKKKIVPYKDIMGLPHKENAKVILEKVDSVIQSITKNIADKIKELNGGKPVSAVFIVGGGGKIAGFASYLADFLKLPKERVALRGKEVLGEIEFEQEEIKKDSLIVTPVGICLNYYEQSNNFIFVAVNGERVKLYDNSRLTIVDAAMQIGIQNEMLFAQRGKPLNFTVDGKARLVRGDLGEPAVVMLNERQVGINNSIVANDVIEITYSTVGADAEYTVGQLPEYKGTISFHYEDKTIVCPKFVRVNDTLVSEYYKIQEGDRIQILNYYTLGQVLEFMDLEYKGNMYVNNIPATLEDKVYENFTISCGEDIGGVETEYLEYKEEEPMVAGKPEENYERKAEEISVQIKQLEVTQIQVHVNDLPVLLTGKSSYILVDILDVYEFDMSRAGELKLVRQINGIDAEFTDDLHDGDQIILKWR